MKTAYSFIRWSSKIQGLEGKDSRVRQTDSAKEWLTKHGNGQYVLSDKVFIGDGESGYTGKHLALDEYGKAKGSLARFIEEVETGKIARDSVLCIDDFSRFSRLEPTQALTLFSNVMSSGIGLVFTSSHEKNVIDNAYLKKHPHVLYFIVGELIRTFTESEERGKKVRTARSNIVSSIKNGVVHRNNLPRYVTFVPAAPTPKCNIGKYVHNDNTKIVKEIVEMFLHGASLYSIANDMNARKVKTFKDKDVWSGNSISNILKNRLLIGEYKGVKNYITPIIGHSEFNKVQTILNNNTFNRGQKGEFINIFRGVCFCKCGAPMSVMSSKYKGETYRYLRCNRASGSKNATCIIRKTIPLSQMEMEFFVNGILNTPRELVNDNDNKEVKQLKDSITVNQIKLQKLDGKAKTLYALADGESNISELKDELAKVNNAREVLKREIDTLNNKVSNVVDAPDTFVSLKKLLGEAKNTQAKFDELIYDGKPTIDPAEWTKLSTANKKAFSALQRSKETIQVALKDNYIREGVRIMLPPLIGKIEVNADEGHFYIQNRLGKVIYKSERYQSQRFNSVKWTESLANRGKRPNNGKK